MHFHYSYITLLAFLSSTNCPPLICSLLHHTQAAHESIIEPVLHLQCMVLVAVVCYQPGASNGHNALFCLHVEHYNSTL